MAGNAWLIAAGTELYDDPAWDRLNAVPDEVESVTACFQELGYVRVLEDVSVNPTRQAFRDALGLWCKSTALTSLDRLVLYYSGHGEQTENDQQYLIFKDSPGPQFASLSVAVEDVVRQVLHQTPLQQVLIVLDTCYSGKGIQDAQKLAAVASAQKDPRQPMYVYLMSATAPARTAVPNRFVPLFARAIRNDDGVTDAGLPEFLHPDTVLERVNREMRGQSARGAVMNSSGEPRLIPNLYRQRLLDVHRNDIEAHWVPHVRGSERDDSAWYFTGRHALLSDLVAWLATPSSAGRARWVTGGPGSGKSSVLAWLVTMSDDRLRTEPAAARVLASVEASIVPPAGAIGCAVHARGKSLAQIVAQIALRLGHNAVASIALQSTGIDPARELVAAIVQAKARTTIAIDALDESPDAAPVARELLSPLSGQDHVWLLVGSRPARMGPSGPALPELGPNVDTFDLEDKRWSSDDDLATYVRARLLAKDEPQQPTPYRDRPELATRIAQAVAARAQRNFLIARLVVRDLLARREPIDSDSPGWQERFPAEVSVALGEDLAQFDRVPLGELRKDDVLDLMESLAYARGDGLSETPWRLAASSASGRQFLPRDMRALLERAPYYFVMAPGRTGPVYRPFHQALAEYLVRPGREHAVHRSIVETFVQSASPLPGAQADWDQADPYALAHLAEHAAAAGAIDALLQDLRFVLRASPSSMLRALPSTKHPASLQVARSYELVAHRFAGEAPPERCAYLEVGAIRLGFTALATRLRDLERAPAWRARWIRWADVPPHRVVATHRQLSALAIGRHEGRTMVVTGGGDTAAVQFWDAATGEALGRVASTPSPTVQVLAWANVDGLLVVAGGYDGRTWAVDLQGALRWQSEPSEKSIRALAPARREGVPVILCADQDGHVCVRDARTGRAVREFWNEGGASSLAVIEREDRSWVAIGGWDGSITVRAIEGNDEQKTFKPFRYATRALAAVRLGDRDYVAATGQPGELCLVEPFAGEVIGPVDLEDDYAIGLSTADWNGQPSIVCGTSSGRLSLHSLPDLACIGRLATGLHFAIDSVVVPPGESVAYATARDDAVRRWDLLLAPWNRDVESQVVVDFDCGRWDDTDAIVAACDDQSVRIVRRDDGQVLVNRKESFDDVGLARVCFAPTAIAQRIVIAGPPGLIHVWDSHGSAPIGKAQPQGRNRVVAIRYFDARGSSFVAVLELDGQLRLFQLETSQQLREARLYGTDLDFFSQDESKFLLIGTANRAVWALDPLSLARLALIPPDATRDGNRVMAVAVSHSGDPLVAAATKDGRVWIWEFRTRRLRAGPFALSVGFPTALAFGTVCNAPVVAIGSVHGEVVVRDIALGTLKCRMQVANVSRLAMPADSQLAVASLTGLMLFDISS